MLRQCSFMLVSVICCTFTWVFHPQLLLAQKALPTPLLQADKLYEEANVLYNQNEGDSGLYKYQQARMLYVEKGIYGLNLTETCFNLGVLYQMRGQSAKAIQLYKESISFSKHTQPVIDSNYFETFVYIGGNFVDLNNYDSAQVYFGQAEKIIARYPNISGVGRFYNEMGYLYNSYGNYKQSINYYEKALDVINSKSYSKEKWVNRHIIYNNNIALALRKLQRHQEALTKFKGLLQYATYPSVIYHNIGATYIQMKQYDNALAYLNKVPVDSLYSAGQKSDFFISLGTAYQKRGSFTQALLYFEKARQLSMANFGEKNVQLARAYLGKGEGYEAEKKPKQALGQYQAAIQALHFTFASASIYQNPSDLSNALSGLVLFETLRCKANAFRNYFHQTQHVADLEASLQTYQLALRLADQIRKSYDSDAAKLFFTNQVFPVYEEAIGTAFQLYGKTQKAMYLEMAFAFAERSKAAVLAESLRELEIKKIPGIPMDLLNRERQLKQNMTRLSLMLAEAKESKQKASVRTQIRNDEIKLAAVVREFEKNPQYFRLKYDTTSVKIKELQQQVLEKHTALVEYFLGKDYLYVFIVSRNGFEAKQLPIVASFKKDLAQLQQALYTLKTGAHYQGNASAFRLYQQLILPIASALEGNSRIIVVPDADLSYLPFEALVSNAASARYLVEDYTISYAYSGTLLQNTLEQRHARQENSVLAMAPFVDKNLLHNQTSQTATRAAALSPLYASRKEVEQVGGRIYLAGEATKELFMQSAGDYSIIHLATHAKADNDEPLNSYIAFYPRNTDSLSSYRLYTQELYNLRLDSVKLVVLSACETGSGRLVRGEGIMSLARAFAYAGCPSIVTTLWKADDQATAYITARMHTYLKEGEPKDIALCKAKLDYLQNQTDPRKKAPYYWANFVFIGDQSPLYANYSWLWWCAGAISLLALALWLYRRT
ncbi:MAG: CHAT domain-containing protein [Bacteroidota bacterium]